MKGAASGYTCWMDVLGAAAAWVSHRRRQTRDTASTGVGIVRRTPGPAMGAADGMPTMSARPAAEGPATMSTRQLCLAWRVTYAALQITADGDTRRRIVSARVALLDELERRDQQGFARWLQAGARAGGDPGRFLTPVGRTHGRQQRWPTPLG